MGLNPTTWPRTAKLVVAFATLYIVWGTTYLAIRIGLDADMPPAGFLALRLIPAGLILLGFARMRGTSLKVSIRDRRTIITVGLFLLLGGQYFTYLAEQHIPSGLAALILAALPLWAAVIDSVMPDVERPTWRGYLGIVLGLSGLGLLLYPRLTGISGGKSELLGIGLEILATALWTTGSFISKRRPVKTDAIVATAYEMLTAGIVLSVIATIGGEWSQVTLTPSGLGALLYLILMGSCVAFTSFVWLLRNVPTSKVMTYAFVNPVVAVLLGWAVLSEPLDIWVIAGMSVIVMGVALTTTAPTRSPRSATSPAPVADPVAESA